MSKTCAVLRPGTGGDVDIVGHAHDSYGAWREGDHDDLVLAVSMPVWWLNRGKHRVDWESVRGLGTIEGYENKWAVGAPADVGGARWD